MIKRFFIFLLLNFAGLAIGGIFTQAVEGSWYQSLLRAPWEPAGWVFGAAWTTIMILFSYYMASGRKFLDDIDLRIFYLTFAGAWVLNAMWNPIFFYFHQTEFALFVIIILTLFVFRFVQVGWRSMKWEWILVMPYLIWMAIATSLNGYVVAMN
jgi:tryptophan-rich sensory protein